MFRPRAPQPRGQQAPQGGDSPAPNPEHAWKLLSLVNEWIHHSDAKAGVTLAFTGALGTMLFNLTRAIDRLQCVSNAVALLAGALLVLTVALCAWTLLPRVDDSEAQPDAVNRLFFGSIASNFTGNRELYRETLVKLTGDPNELTRDLADQIHANARIATVKARAAKRAIQSALAAGATVALLATMISAANF